jgi:hypothetical protein
LEPSCAATWILTSVPPFFLRLISLLSLPDLEAFPFTFNPLDLITSDRVSELEILFVKRVWLLPSLAAIERTPVTELRAAIRVGLFIVTVRAKAS